MTLNKDWEADIQPIKEEVEAEYKMGGLSDGLYGDFATEVAIRFAKRATAKAEERVAKRILIGYVANESLIENRRQEWKCAKGTVVWATNALEILKKYWFGIGSSTPSIASKEQTND